ncbi:hypothetical protein DN062_16150 [Nitrincola tibetensis]|uniref:Diguanylate cyclase n=1 Tax=Nitrincola tibetensis TaxID=2219697 RepID=A0A364NI37_9GAMM|nr:hypothetical protein DN062_16150 [Nitrincola tibetensis]
MLRGVVKLDSNAKQVLRNKCNTLFLSFIDDVVDHFFASVPAHLKEAGLEADSLRESSYFIKLANDFDILKPNISKKFKTLLHERIQSDSTHTPSFLGSSDTAVLELVDETEFDDWLKIATVSEALEAKYSQSMLDFEARYGVVLNLTLDRNNNPFGPRLVCRSFQDAIKDEDFNNPIRAILYTALGHSLEQDYPVFLQHLATVLEDVTPRVEIKKPTERPAELDLPKPTVQPRSESRVAEPNAPYSTKRNEASRSNAESSFAQILELLDQESSPLPASAVGRSSQASAIDNSIRVLSRLTAVLNNTRQTLVSREGQAANKRAKPIAHAAGQAAPMEEILAGIESMSAGHLTRSQSVAQSPAEQLQTYLSVNAGQARSIPAHQAEVLNGAARLFTRARSEHDEASDIDSLLKRLERPLLKLMLKDLDFLMSDVHPARDVVNLIDQFAMAADSKGHFFDAKLRRFLAIQVDLVDREFSKDPEVFSRVRDKLQKIIQPIRKARRNRVFRTQQRYESQNVLRNARERVDAFLETRLGGERVPVLIIRLLELGWRQYLVLLQLHMDADKRKQAISVFDLMLRRLMQESVSETFSAMELAEDITQGLISVGADAHEIKPLRLSLLAALTQPEGVVDYVEVPRRAVPDLSESKLGITKHLDVGHWWLFLKDGRWVPMQLIWQARSGGLLGFVDRSASEQQSLTLEELSERVAQETAKENEKQSLPLLERSEYALFDESYRDLIHQALHDPATGLANRKALFRKMNAAAADASALGHSCLCQIEFDQTRVVYSNCGMDAGDRLLKDLASKIEEVLLSSQQVSVVNSDTFILLLPDVVEAQGREIAAQIVTRLSDYRFEHDREIYSIGLNIGLVEYTPSLMSVDAILRQADSACLAAKSEGRNRFRVYESYDAQLQAQEALKEWAGRIDRIIESNGLYLRCQKVAPVDEASELLPYYEVLLGIRDNGAHVVSFSEEAKVENIQPADFFPAVERWKRSHEIDLWVLAQVFDWIRQNRHYFDQIGGFAINLSAQSLSNAAVLEYLRQQLSNHDLPMNKITFEITETAAIDSYAKAREFMAQVGSFGCQFSLDDFGTGFASYSHLKNLKAHSLKIDGSFVKDIADNPADYAMVKSMNEIGHFLGMKTVAEFVESPAILEKLKEIGVDYAQGYAVHKPIPVTELLKEEFNVSIPNLQVVKAFS